MFANAASSQHIAFHGRRWRFEMEHMRQNLARADDRRGRQRFNLNAPLIVKIGDREFPAYTRDLSNRGVYFFLGSDDTPLIDHDFDFTLELPPEITLSTCCLIQCRGRATRIESASRNLIGVAAEILSYSIVREPVQAAYSLRIPSTRWSTSQLFST